MLRLATRSMLPRLWLQPKPPRQPKPHLLLLQPNPLLLLLRPKPLLLLLLRWQRWLLLVRKFQLHPMLLLRPQWRELLLLMKSQELSRLGRSLLQYNELVGIACRTGPGPVASCQ